MGQFTFLKYEEVLVQISKFSMGFYQPLNCTNYPG